MGEMLTQETLNFPHIPGDAQGEAIVLDGHKIIVRYAPGDSGQSVLAQIEAILFGAENNG